jgi:hypothetical protein
MCQPRERARSAISRPSRMWSRMSRPAVTDLRPEARAPSNPDPLRHSVGARTAAIEWKAAFGPVMMVRCRGGGQESSYAVETCMFESKCADAYASRILCRRRTRRSSDRMRSRGPRESTLGCAKPWLLLVSMISPSGIRALIIPSFRPAWGRFHKGMRPPFAGNVTTKQAPPPDGDLWCTVAP